MHFTASRYSISIFDCILMLWLRTVQSNCKAYVSCITVIQHCYCSTPAQQGSASLLAAGCLPQHVQDDCVQAISGVNPLTVFMYYNRHTHGTYKYIYTEHISPMCTFTLYFYVSLSLSCQAHWNAEGSSLGSSGSSEDTIAAGGAGNRTTDVSNELQLCSVTVMQF